MFAGGLLSLTVPPEPCWAGGGLATLSWLSQCPCPHDGKSGVCRWGGTVGPRQGPRIPQGPQPALLAPCPAGTLTPHERAVSPARLRAPCRERGIHSAGGCPAPRRGTSTPRAEQAGDAVSPLTAATGTSQALAFNVHEERGGGQGRAVLGEQVDVAIPWGQSRAERGARGRSPQSPAVGRGRPPTFPHAGQGQGELPHEVVAGGAVVVLHHEAHQCQLRCLQLEGQRLLPARVEA